MKTPEQKLWDKLVSELKQLNDNNYTARIIYDYIIKKFGYKYYDLDNNSNIIESNPPTLLLKPVLPSNELKLKLEAMCLEYANMKSRNNEASAQLLFDIRELTKALNAINGKIY